MKSFGQIQIFVDEYEWKKALINHFYSKLANIITIKGRALVALSGGSTPYPIYECIADDVRSNPRIASLLQVVDFILVDERVVPLVHPDSNGGKLKSLWEGLPLRLHLIDEKLEPTHAALEYENCIKELIGLHSGIDIVLLGMGVDGHTASLFPNSKGLDELNALFLLNERTDGAFRYTLSFKALREATERIVILSGKEKMAVFKELISTEARQFPIERLMFDQGSVLQWFYLLSND